MDVSSRAEACVETPRSLAPAGADPPMVASRFRSRRSVQAVDVVVRRLGGLASLSEREVDLVRRLSGDGEVHAANSVVLAAETEPSGARFIISGWACRYRILPDGRRQVFCFLLPGDGIALGGPRDAGALASVGAVTELQTVDGEAVRRAAANRKEHPGLAQSLYMAVRAEEALLLNQLVRLGRQTAYERAAHLLLELHERLALVGLTQGYSFPLPVTQEVLADILGLSVVHVNRTLQQLKREKLIEVRGGEAKLLAPQVLTALSNYRSRDLAGGKGGEP
ncbi:MAG: Crp/Fnr family transcriptional regulator [Phenylobacterium sp.]|uniref:Crp/Fnr family transcriptional regulator n=1 Tax=Phenylobacterium sp. TaxID=1871053 RepID=UPI003919B688